VWFSITSGHLLTICANAARNVDPNAGMEGDPPSWPAPARYRFAPGTVHSAASRNCCSFVAQAAV